MIHAIDTHQHFWRYSAEEYGWIDDSMRELQHDHLPADAAAAMMRSGVAASVAVQARQSIEETRWLLDLAREHRTIAGVVGWLPLAETGIGQELPRWAADSALKGLRHIVQAETDGFLLQPDFQRGMDALLPTGLVYDILIRAGQLEEAIAFVDRNPNQVFVLDHLAKPEIRTAGWEPWSAQIGKLAERPNVTAKLSGLVTEADWERWTDDELARYMDRALEVFTPRRLMAGSDWPVCTVAASYERWWTFLRGWCGRLSESEQKLVLHDVALTTYSLKLEQQEPRS